MTDLLMDPSLGLRAARTLDWVAVRMTEGKRPDRRTLGFECRKKARAGEV